jgi:hypothetical protein
MLNRVFLGGTCNGSNWREDLTKLLKVEYFNPVVENWTPECQTIELSQREHCKFCLYVITPKMTGFYSIAEVVDDSNKRPSKTILCVLVEDAGLGFDAFQIKSMNAVKKLVASNGGTVLESLEQVADYVNNNME